MADIKFPNYTYALIQLLLVRNPLHIFNISMIFEKKILINNHESNKFTSTKVAYPK